MLQRMYTLFCHMEGLQYAVCHRSGEFTNKNGRYRRIFNGDTIVVYMHLFHIPEDYNSLTGSHVNPWPLLSIKPQNTQSNQGCVI